jgi:hypothetical protein
MLLKPPLFADSASPDGSRWLKVWLELRRATLRQQLVFIGVSAVRARLAVPVVHVST